MEEFFRKEKITQIILAMVLLAYFSAVCMVNFSEMPGTYDSDIYLDILYSQQAWENKSLFPEGWVFGNQFYVVSTPAIAAVLMSVFDPPDAMAAASTLIAAALILSFSWMLKPVVKSREARLLGMSFFMAIVLFCGNAYRGYNGWQLLFTMCSYYGMYAVIAFLAFGIYLRADKKWSVSLKALLTVTCLLCFGIGMQSLRQTAVMTCPLIAVEVLRIIGCRISGKKADRRPLLAAGLLSGANILGLVVIRLMDIPQRQMNINSEVPGISEMIASIPDNLLYAYSMFGIGGKTMLVIFWSILALCGVAGCRIVWHAWKNRQWKGLQLLLLFTLGVMAVFAVGILGVLRIRHIYYFMCYPMIAFLVAYACWDMKKAGMGLGVLFLALLTCCSWQDFREEVLTPVLDGEDGIYEVADYLLENGYTTIYSEWDNAGEDVAVAADGKLRVGYWGWEYTPFESIRYLCNPDIYEEDPSCCVYLFRGQDRAMLGCEAADALQVELTLMRYFEDSDLYVYTAPVNLMAMH